MHRAARCTAQPLRPFAAAARISPEGATHGEKRSHQWKSEGNSLEIELGQG